MPRKAIQRMASLELKTTGERGELLTCTPKSTHPDARKRLDLAAAIASKRNSTRRFSIYEDENRAAIDATWLARANSPLMKTSTNAAITLGLET